LFALIILLSCHFKSFVRVIRKIELLEIINGSYKSLQSGNIGASN